MIRKVVTWINILSLDVLLGALCSGYFAAKIVGAEMEPVYWVVLGITVWVVYMLDHLLDAHRLKARSHSLRHDFAYRHFRIISLSAFVLLIIDVLLVVLFLEIEFFIFGAIAGILIMIYFLGIFLTGEKHSVLLQKEIIVAFFYTAGIWGGPMLKTDLVIRPAIILCLAAFYCLAVSNALVLSCYDHDSDRKDGHVSFAILFGQSKTTFIIYLLSALVSLIAMFIVVCGNLHNARAIAIIFIIMATSMVMLIRLSKYRNANSFFRISTEGVFWWPIMLFFV